ncbi:MAG: glycosyltransferase [Deltaproteobacteria bacterium]|nr:glycosyltransferase [Deltaproteobacteria bacterium]
MNILILYPHLGPGVANFLIDLAICLKGRGHRPLLATRGGAGLEKLTQQGIEHRLTELAFPGFIGELGPLARLVREREVDIIDCRDYRAGSVGYILSRMTNRPYLLGIHAPRKGYNRFLVYYWSKPVMAVNRSVRDNLVRDFGVPEEQVRITSTAIDTAHFTWCRPDAGILGELRIDESTPVVMIVSRFERKKTGPAKTLIDSLKEVEKSIPGITAVLVGPGDDIDMLRERGAETNAALGRDAVKVLGFRKDIRELLSVARLVVGTGKAAIEAMACGKPLIGAGRYGTVGLVTRDRAQVAEDTHFGDLGEADPFTVNHLSGEMMRLFENPALEEDLRNFGPVFAKKYDVNRVADTILQIYHDKLNGKWD